MMFGKEIGSRLLRFSPAVTGVAAMILLAALPGRSLPNTSSVVSTSIPIATQLTNQENTLRTLPMEPDELAPQAIPAGSAIVASYNISQASLTLPSLWWTQEQFGGKLLILWLAYPENVASHLSSAASNEIVPTVLPRRVELVINDQIWSLYNYLDRYAFLNQFGVAAREYGYSTRVVNRDGRVLATYTCIFAATQNSGSHCQTWVDAGGLSGVQANPLAPGTAPPATPQPR